LGLSGQLVASNVVDPQFVPQLDNSERGTDWWTLDLERKTARLEKPPTGLEHLELALDPMLGCFGVAPPRGQAISTATSSTHGGNMDYRGFREGVTVFLPSSSTARCSTSATGTRSRATARSSAPASRSRWTS